MKSNSVAHIGVVWKLETSVINKPKGPSGYREKLIETETGIIPYAFNKYKSQTYN